MAENYVRKIDFHDLELKPGDQVVFGPMKSFQPLFYVKFADFFGEQEEGPFEVVQSYPLFNYTEIIVGGRHIWIDNDFIKKLYWN
ncbi:MAG: hypothetical protein WAV16_03440 [Candidatus Moraniibacteriota bacterium]